MADIDNLGLVDPTIGGDFDTWGATLDTNRGKLGSAAGTQQTIATTGGTTAITATQSNAAKLNITGTLVSNSTIEMLATVSRFWFITNATSGAFTVTVTIAGSGGTTVELTQGTSSTVFVDGTDVTTHNLSNADGNLSGARIDAGTLPIAKISAMTSNTLVGNITAGSAVPTEVAIIVSPTLAGSSDDNVPSTEAIKTFAENLSFSSALPGQGGNAGKILTTDGATATWDDIDTINGDPIVGESRLINSGTGITGGGDLSADRTLAIDIASEAEAQTGTDNTKVITPLRAHDAASTVLGARTINTSVGITGGGALSSDLTLDIDTASLSEAQTGTDNTKVMTPLRTAQSITANERAISSQAAAEAGTDNTVDMTPLRVLQAIVANTQSGRSVGSDSIIRTNNTNIQENIDLWELNLTVTADAGDDTLSAGTDDDYADGDTVRLSTTTTLPAGLAIETTYYVVSVAAATLKVSATFGGSAINITDTGTGTHTLYKIVNGSTIGPVTIETGSTVTIKSGSTWSIA